MNLHPSGQGYTARLSRPQKKISPSKLRRVNTCMQELADLCREQEECVSGQFEGLIQAEGEIKSLLQDHGLSEKGRLPYPVDQTKFVRSQVDEVLLQASERWQKPSAPRFQNQIEQLYRQICSLRDEIPKYQAEIVRLRNQNPGSNGLKELLEQRQKIREETLFLLSSRRRGSGPASQIRLLKEKCQTLQEENKNLRSMNREAPGPRLALL